MENVKYLLDGAAVEVVETLGNGFLVSYIYDIGNEAEEDFTCNDNKPFYVDKVFDKAPTKKQDEVLASLNKSIQEYTDKRNSLQKEVWELDKSYKEKVKKYSLYNHPAINLLDNFLDNKITHFAYAQHGNVGIVEKNKIARYQSDFNLFFELDITYDKIKWGTYLKNGSYDRVLAFPCESHEQALEHATNLLNDAFSGKQHSWKDNYIQSAQKLNIPVPAEYMDALKQEKIKNTQSNIDSHLKTIEALKKELESIK